MLKRLVRPLLAAILGSLLGALLYFASSLIPLGFETWTAYDFSGGSPDLYLLAVLYAICSGFWLVGILVFGGFGWLVLSRFGLTGWKSAALMGAALTFPAVLILSLAVEWNLSEDGKVTANNGIVVAENSDITAYGYEDGVEQALLVAAEGGLIGFLVWRIGYRQRQTSFTA